MGRAKSKFECVPPKSITRNDHGLIETQDYVFNPDGLVNWRKRVKPEFLVPNRQRTQETDIEALQDKDLIILLGGLKDLSQIRGYSNVKYEISVASPEYAATSCTITWIPNYETEGREIVFESMSSATLENTNGFGQKYLIEMAENRSFCRCVRNFLKINIVSWDELAGAQAGGHSSNVHQTQPSNSSARNAAKPSFLLAKKMKEKNLSFEQVWEKIKNESLVDNPDKITELEDIPKNIVFKLIERMNALK
ncbi:MAG TPA: hypothetical protein DEG69_05685 [Flavobacteriaceae bacterium]|nr:hypothetical protein [Flavobacteriaceae bacterium]